MSLLASAVTAAATLVAADVPRSLARPFARSRIGRGDDRAALTVPAPVERLLRRAGVDPDPAAVLVWLQVVGVATAAGVVVPACRVIALVAAVGPPAAVVALGDRAARRRRHQLPAALDAIASGLRGGQALAGAIGHAASVGAPLGPELTAVAADTRSGRTTVEALDRWQRSASDADTDLAIAALAVAASVGGPGARAVDAAAASLRDRHAADAELSALATQGKASAAVLTVAPVVFAVLLTLVDPSAGSFLLGTPVGWTCIVVGGTLDAIGAWWMSRVVRSAR